MKFLSAWEALAPEDRNESFTTKTQLWRWTGENCFLILILLLSRPQPRVGLGCCCSCRRAAVASSRKRGLGRRLRLNNPPSSKTSFAVFVYEEKATGREGWGLESIGAMALREKVCLRVCEWERKRACVRASERCSWESKRRTHQVASWQSRWSSTLRRCWKETSRSVFLLSFEATMAQIRIKKKIPSSSGTWLVSKRSEPFKFVSII